MMIFGPDFGDDLMPHDLTADGCARPGSGVGRFCCELIKLGLPYETIARLARERFGGKTSENYVRWYASQRRAGKLAF
jgi:hypothetical protein